MMSTVPTVYFKNFLVKSSLYYTMHGQPGRRKPFSRNRTIFEPAQGKIGPSWDFRLPPPPPPSSPLTRKSWLRHWHIHRKNVKQRTVRVRAGSTNKRDTMTNEFSPPAVLHQAYVTMSVACRNIEVCSRHVTLKGRCWPNFHNDKHHLSTGVS